ncbi:hypothetical protein [Anatilimnocola floriformis]|uniref:hypothetical protein n=1 Tax=Anatilimnocola floriformis TaxID=2948575 RepID=UPI0020C574AF|nr:hypothetical protein [Anatilimnocola floriformis]
MKLCLYALAVWLASVATLPALEVEVKNLSAALYSEIATLHEWTHESPAGVMVVYQPPKGKLLCGVSYQLSITWGKDNQYEVPRKEIGIERAIGIGTLDEFGGLKIQKIQDWDMTGLRIYNTQEFKTTIYCRHPLYLLEPGTKEIDFKLAGKSHKLKLDKPPQPFDPTSSCKIEVLQTERHASVPLKVHEYPDQLVKLSSTLTNPGGSVLAVQVRAQVQTVGYDAFVKNNSGLEINRFFLSFAKGGRAICLGNTDKQGIFDVSGPKFTAKNEPQTTTLYFAVPANVTAFELNYMGHPVGKCTAEVQP